MPAGPLSYEGQVAVPYITRAFAPSTSNNKFLVPTIWIDTASEDAYILTGRPQGVARWINIANSNSIETLTTNVDTYVAIASVPVAVGTATLVKGDFLASNAAHTDITSGSIYVAADGTLGIVGSPITNVESTTTGTFRVIFSAGNLVFQVKAPSVTTYNWQFTYLPDSLT